MDFIRIQEMLVSFVDRDMFMRYRGGGIGHVDIAPENQPQTLETEVGPPENDEGWEKERHRDTSTAMDDDSDRASSEEDDFRSEAGDTNSESGDRTWLLNYLTDNLDYQSEDSEDGSGFEDNDDGFDSQ
ncbi:hypothetical protein BDP27DRAFT_1432439 [Rhodocollybia butyracea]|uniref:Uncharacterized protein n=1 Tax=Rhodocollybia butyracea TaxID=206335 RepID=A0A9P5TYQ9_9AGAR|nr:hypothetical protein BDP27DRAFT_1432439 [Rhodocollybia butyracea]